MHPLYPLTSMCTHCAHLGGQKRIGWTDKQTGGKIHRDALTQSWLMEMERENRIGLRFLVCFTVKFDFVTETTAFKYKIAL